MPSLKPSSYDRLKQTYLKQIKNTSVGRSQLGTLTSLGIQALINSYTTTLSYSTLKKVYDLLNNCYRYAVATRNIGYNPVDGVQLPKQENMSIQTKEIAILPDVDVELLEAAQSMCYKTGRLRYWYAPPMPLFSIRDCVPEKHLPWHGIMSISIPRHLPFGKMLPESKKEIPPMPPAVSRLSPLQNHALALGRFHLTITLWSPWNVYNSCRRTIASRLIMWSVLQLVKWLFKILI